MSDTLDPITMLPDNGANELKNVNVLPVTKTKRQRDLANSFLENTIFSNSPDYAGAPLGNMLGEDGDNNLPSTMSIDDLFNPETTEQLRGANQSNWDKFGNAVMQTVFSQFVGGTIAGLGYITGVDDIAKFGEGIQESIDKNFQIHSPYGKDASLGEMASSFSWYMENLPSVASSLSLMIPALGSTKLLSFAGKALKYEEWLAKTAKWGAKLIESGEAASAAGEAAKAEKLLKYGQSITKAGNYMVQGFVSREGENGMEMKQTRDQALDSFSKKLAKERMPDLKKQLADYEASGKLVSIKDAEGNVIGAYNTATKEGEDAIRAKWEANIKKDALVMANEAADLNGNLNWILWLQDVAQYALLGRVFGKASKGLIAEYKIAGSKGLSGLPIVGKKVIAGAWDLAGEGAEEIYQYQSNAESIYLTENKYGLLHDKAESSNTFTRLKNRMSNPQLQTAGIWGALGAGVFQSAGRGINNLMSKQLSKSNGVAYKSEAVKAVEAVKANNDIIAKWKSGIDKATERGDKYDLDNEVNGFLVSAVINSKQTNTYNNLLDSLAAMSSGKMSKEEMKAFGIEESELSKFSQYAKESAKLVDEVSKKYDMNLSKYKNHMFAELITSSEFSINNAKNNINSYKTRMDELVKKFPNIENVSKEDLEIVVNRAKKSNLERDIANLEKNVEFSTSKAEDEAKIKVLKTDLAEVNKELKDKKLSKSVDFTSKEWEEFNSLQSKININKSIIGRNQERIKFFSNKKNRNNIEKALSAKKDAAFAKAVNNLDNIDQIAVVSNSIRNDKQKTEHLNKVIEKKAAEQKTKVEPFDLSSVDLENKPFKESINDVITKLAKRYKGNPHLQYSEQTKYGVSDFEGLVNKVYSNMIKGGKAYDEMVAYFNNESYSDKASPSAATSSEQAENTAPSTKEDDKAAKEEAEKEATETTEQTNERLTIEAEIAAEKAIIEEIELEERIAGEDKVNSAISLLEHEKQLLISRNEKTKTLLRSISAILNSGNEFSSEKIDKLNSQIKLLNSLIRPNHKKNKGRILKRIDAINSEISEEFSSINHIANTVRKLNDEISEFESIIKDVDKQIKYYKSILSDKNYKTISNSELQSKVNKLESKANFLSKIIRHINKIINKLLTLLKRHVDYSFSVISKLNEFIDSNNFKELSTKELRELIDNGVAESYTKIKVKVDKLTDDVNSALDDVDSLEEKINSKRETLKPLHEKIVKIDNQVRYLNDLINNNFNFVKRAEVRVSKRNVLNKSTKKEENLKTKNKKNKKSNYTPVNTNKKKDPQNVKKNSKERKKLKEKEYTESAKDAVKYLSKSKVKKISTIANLISKLLYEKKSTGLAIVQFNRLLYYIYNEHSGEKLSAGTFNSINAIDRMFSGIGLNSTLERLKAEQKTKAKEAPEIIETPENVIEIPVQEKEEKTEQQIKNKYPNLTKEEIDLLEAEDEGLTTVISSKYGNNGMTTKHSNILIFIQKYNKVDQEFVKNGEITEATPIHIEVDYELTSNEWHSKLSGQNFIDNFAIQLVVYDEDGRHVIGTLRRSGIKDSPTNKIDIIRKYVYNNFIKDNNATSGTVQTGISTNLDRNSSNVFTINYTSKRNKLSEFKHLGPIIFGVTTEEGIINWKDADVGLTIRMASGRKPMPGDMYVLLKALDGTYRAFDLSSNKISTSKEDMDSLRETIVNMLSKNAPVDMIIKDIEQVTSLSKKTKEKLTSLLNQRKSEEALSVIGNLKYGLDINTLNQSNDEIINSDKFLLNVNPRQPFNRDKIVIKNQFDYENLLAEEEAETEEAPPEEFSDFDTPFGFSAEEATDDSIDDDDPFGDFRIPKFKLANKDNTSTPESDKTTREEELEWANKVTGGKISIEEIDRLITIDRNGGIYAYGQFRDGIIQYYEASPIGTIRHEAFHAIFEYGLSDKEKAIILKHHSEEDLAIKFETYHESFGKQYSGLTGTIAKFFRTIYQMIKSKLVNNMSIDELFFRVHTGIYKKSTIKNSEIKPTHNPKRKLLTLTDMENEDAIIHVSNIFSDVVDELEKGKYSHLKRQSIIKSVGVDEIIYHSILRMIKQAEKAKNDGDLVMHAKLTDVILGLGKWDKYSRVMEYSPFGTRLLKRITDTEGILVSIGKDNRKKIEDVKFETDIYNETEEEENKPLDWKVKASSESAKFRLSLITRRALFNIRLFKKNPVTKLTEPQLNSFGSAKMFKYNTAYNNLKSELSGILDEKDMMVRLNNYIVNKGHYQYIDLLNKLKKDKKLRSSFFLDFRKSFTESIVSVRVKIGNKFEYRTSSVNTTASKRTMKNRFLGGFSSTGIDKALFDELYPTYKLNIFDVETAKQIMNSIGLGENNVYINDKTNSAFFTKLSTIVEMVNNGKELFVEDNKASYIAIKEMSNELAKTAEEVKESSYIDVNGKLRYSHDNPNFLSTFVNKIKNPVYRARWAASKKNDVFLKDSVWRAELSNINNVALINKFSYYMLNGVADDASNIRKADGKDYTNMTVNDYVLSGITQYVNNLEGVKKYDGTSFTNGTAMFRVPVLSDSPTMYGVRFRRYSNSKIIDNMFRVALQELGRINFLKESTTKFKNLSENGTQFVMLPFLNDSIDLFDDVTENEEQIKELISKWLDTQVEKEIASMKDEGSYDLMDRRTETVFGKDSNKDEFLKNYVYNSIFATSQIISLTIGDPAFYKIKKDNEGKVLDITDIFKRAKEISSPGTPLNTEASYTGADGKTTDVRHSFKAIFTNDIKFNISKEHEAKIRKIFKDFGYTETQIENIVKQFKGIDSTDGQTFITLDRYKEIMIGLEKWNPSLEASYQNLKNNTHSNIDIANISMNPIKPFFFSHRTYYQEGSNKSMTIPTQIKNSEFVMIPELMNTPELRETPLGKLYERHFSSSASKSDLADSVIYSSAIKVGEYDVSKYDAKNKTWNTKIHNLNNSDYMYQQETPIHRMDAENIFGTQIRKIIIANLPNNSVFTVNGKEMSKEETVNEYVNLITANIKESAKGFDDIVGNPERLQKAILNQILRDDLRADFSDTVKDVYENGTKKFLFPMSYQTISKKMQSMLLSLGRKNIIKQKISGAAMIQFSGVIFDNKLNVEYNKDGSIQYLEVAMPYTTMAQYGLKEGDEVPEELQYMLGYRIPTEDKSSASVLKVTRILPAESGDSIALPPEVITLNGSDFDIDKFFVMTYKSEKVPDTTAPDYSKIVKALANKKIVATEDEVKQAAKDKKDWDKLRKKKPNTKVSEFFKDKVKSYNIIRASNELKYEERVSYKIQKVKYDESKSSEENSKSARDNRILDIMISIMRNKDVSDLTIVPSGFTEFQSAVDYINGLRGEGSSNVDNAITPRSNAIMFERNMTGAKLIGIGAVARIIAASIEDTDVSLFNYFGLFGEYKSEVAPKYSILEESPSKVFKKLSEKFGDKYANSSEDISNLMYSISNGELVRPQDSELLSDIQEAYGKKFFKHTSKPLTELVAAFVDNAKYPLASFLNINTFTADTFSFGLMLGFDFKDLGLLFSQDSVVKVVKDYANNSSNGMIDATRFIKDRITKLESKFEEDIEAKDLKEVKSDFEASLNPEFKSSNKKDYDLAQLAALKKFAELYDLSKTFFGKAKYTRSDNASYLLNLASLESFVTGREEAISKYHKSLITGVTKIPGLERSFMNKNTLASSFYEEGILKLYNGLKDIFIELSDGFINVKSVLSDALGRKLSEDEINTVNDTLKAYLYSKYSSDNLGISSSSRIDLLENFPEEFSEFKKNNEELVSSNLFLKRLNIIPNFKPANRYKSNTIKNIIAYENFSSLNGTEVMDVVNDYKSMLESEDPAIKEFAIKLYKYSKAIDNGVFSYSSFTNLAPLAFESSLNEKGLSYTKFLRMIDENAKHNFKKSTVIDYITRFLLHNTEIVPTLNKEEIASIDKDSAIMGAGKASNTFISFKLSHDDVGRMITLYGKETYPLVVKIKVNSDITYVYRKNDINGNRYVLTSKLGYGKNINEYNISDNFNSIIDANINDMLRNRYMTEAYNNMINAKNFHENNINEADSELSINKEKEKEESNSQSKNTLNIYWKNENTNSSKTAEALNLNKYYDAANQFYSESRFIDDIEEDINRQLTLMEKNTILYEIYTKMLEDNSKSKESVQVNIAKQGEDGRNPQSTHWYSIQKYFETRRNYAKKMLQKYSNKPRFNIEEVTNNSNLIDISNSKRKSPYFEKDKAKFSNAKVNKLIAFGEKGTSSRAYGEAVNQEQVNTGKYSNNDVVGVTVNGGNNSTIDFQRVKGELSKAIKAKSTIVTDNIKDRERSYNKGERMVADYLNENGYVEESGNGIWKKNTNNNLENNISQKSNEKVSYTPKPSLRKIQLDLFGNPSNSDLKTIGMSIKEWESATEEEQDKILECAGLSR